MKEEKIFLPPPGPGDCKGCAPDGLGHMMGCPTAMPKEFDVTHDELDAPDGAVLELGGVKYERVGAMWRKKR